MAAGMMRTVMSASIVTLGALAGLLDCMAACAGIAAGSAFRITAVFVVYVAAV